MTRIAKALGAPPTHINPPATTPAERMRKAIANSTNEGRAPAAASLVKPLKQSD